MSGLEIAGLVLGAFPIALTILDIQRKVAESIGRWEGFQTEHRKCRSELQIQRIKYKMNLKQLLLPMGILDKTEVDELLGNPESEFWRKDEITKVLEQRLEGSYELYLEYISQFSEALGAIKHELAAESDQAWTEPTQVSQIGGSAAEKLKAQTKWQLYRLKFTQREKERAKLFESLEKCNKRLADLLQISENSRELAPARLSKIGGWGSNAICQLWREASAIFRALSTVWKCDCRAQHAGKLLMEHRTRGPSEFSLLFQKITQSRDEVRNVRVSSKGRASSSTEQASDGNRLQETVAIFEPLDKNDVPRTSSSVMRSMRTPTGSSYLRPPPSITLTEFEPVATKAPIKELSPIKCLCLSLDRSNEACCGYLRESDSLYFVYKDLSKPMSSPEFITLDQLLRKEYMYKPKLKQRLTLAWILSSSFLQLLESPWLPTSWKKSDIIFYQDPKQPGRYALDQPHLNNCLAPQNESGLSADRDCRMQLSPSVEMLGVVLLELCLGKLLDEQPCRTKWPDLERGPSKKIFDIVAAKECLGSVEDKVGGEYAAAVGWCLNGLLCAAPDKWRGDMLRNVVHPFESYHSFLSRDRNV